MDIQSLRKSLLENDLASFSKLYHDFKPYCISTLKSKQLNLDQAQCESIYDDAMLLFRDHLIQEKIQQGSSIKSYITGICINLGRNKMRKEQRYQSKKNEIRLLFQESEHLYEMDDDQSNQRLKRVQGALKQLGEKCQKIIHAHYILGMSMIEIADYLGFASKDVAKTTKSRCFKKLIAIIENQS